MAQVGPLGCREEEVPGRPFRQKLPGVRSLSPSLWLVAKVGSLVASRSYQVGPETQADVSCVDPCGSMRMQDSELTVENTDVFICTSPIKMFKYCPYEKYAWVEKHFGPDFLEQIVLTRDKTVVSADILIDDRPDITGAEPHPTWEHVLFTSCHNQHLQLQPPSRRLHSWADDWKAILDSKRPH
ncbi:Hypothetical predicted protein [Marmota monax]|uniref:Uncharacterized protein n=1 Tax=Marmota monax TaxID=9995 RepID=A0A5E4AZQ0_MARMO|nr:Hypothetical predicted protein [Marmota monax]